MFRKKNFLPSPLCAKMFLHHVDKKALCSMSFVNTGCTSTSGNFPVRTAVIRLASLAEAFVKQSAQAILGWNVTVVEGSELFLLLLPGSSHRFPCGF